MTIDGDRLLDRQTVLRQFDLLRRELDSPGVVDSFDEFHRTACDILMADRVRKAFDLRDENPRLVEDYGEEWGRNALVARRLVEAGVALSPSACPVASNRWMPQVGMIMRSMLICPPL